VEIGNGSNFTTCSHKEIQIPQVWGQSSVDIKINQGTFVADENLYLFVVDSTGNVNNPGFPLVMGGEVTSPTGPGEPGRPILQ
jgi:hypothetical protein